MGIRRTSSWECAPGVVFFGGVGVRGIVVGIYMVGFGLGMRVGVFIGKYVELFYILAFQIDRGWCRMVYKVERFGGGDNG